MSERAPGRFLRERVWEKGVVCGCLVAGALAAAVLGFRVWWVSLLGLSLVHALHRELDGELDPVRDRLGYRGEVLVGDVLAGLRRNGVEYENDVVLGSGNIDHVVFAPSGAFAIETKHWDGRFFTKIGGGLWHSSNGRQYRRDGVVETIDRDSRLVKDVLRSRGFDVFVTPLVVSTKARVWNGGFDVGRVRVIGVEHLAELLTTRTVISPGDRLTAIGAIRDARGRERPFAMRVLVRLRHVLIP